MNETSHPGRPQNTPNRPGAAGMEPIGLGGGGAVALGLFVTAAVGSALLAGGVALALARLGVAVDNWFKRRERRSLR